MAARFNHPADESSKKEHYQRLLNELKSMIEQTESRPINLDERGHLLTCSECGAFEDVTDAEEFVVLSREEEPLPYTEFIMIDGKERIFEKKKPHQCLTTYTFICPACGAYQTAIIREKLEEDVGVEE